MPNRNGKSRGKPGISPDETAGTRYPRLKDLIALVHMLQGSAGGISLADIQERFEVSRRTAERMRDAVRDSFVEVEELRLDDGTKRWRIKDRVLLPTTAVGADDLAALDTIEKILKREPHPELLNSLRRSGDALKGTIRWQQLLHAEPDVQALSEAEGVISHAGPQERVHSKVVPALREAIKGCVVIRLTHWTERAKKPSRGHEVEPLGLLHSIGRRYLVARSLHHGNIHLFRLGRIESVELTTRSFVRPNSFSIENYAKGSFGVFQEPPIEVVWRFRPEAASEARTFLFHPTQKLRSQADGSLMVTFKAGGMLEMCRHLFTWGDSVEIIKPKKLKVMYRKLLSDVLSNSNRPAG